VRKQSIRERRVLGAGREDRRDRKEASTFIFGFRFGFG
jgi:hypothetical protein